MTNARTVTKIMSVNVKKVTTQKQKNYRRVKALLFLHGVSLSEIAKALGVTPAAMSRTIRGQSKSRRIKLAIAAELGKSVEKLWPEERKS